jgi:hypothetical protein
MQRISDEAARRHETLQQQLVAAQTNQNASAQQQILDRMAAVQQEAANAQRESFQAALAREPKMMEMLQLFKNLNGDDPFASKLKELMLENFVNPQGGAPSTAQVVGQLGQSVIDGARSIASAVIDGKTTEARAKQMAEASARQRADALRKQQQAQAQQALVAAQQFAAQQQAQMQANGTQPNGAANGNGVHHAQAPIPVIDLGEAQPQAPEQRTSAPLADDNLDMEERPYFGDAYGPIKALRLAVSNNQIGPEQVVAAVVEAFVFYQGFAMDLPVMRDVVQDPEKAVRRALPDADAAFRRKIVEALPAALKEAMEEDDEAPQGAAQA